jgi:hypothetical protein
MKFIDAPRGARFLLPSSPQVWVKIDSYDRGLIVAWNGNVKGHQSHCCFTDDTYSLESEVEIVDLSDSDRKF